MQLAKIIILNVKYEKMKNTVFEFLNFYPVQCVSPLESDLT